MSFFAKIKQFFGVGTIKVTLNAPGTFNTNDGVIEGTIKLEAKSDQSIVSFSVCEDTHQGTPYLFNHKRWDAENYE